MMRAIDCAYEELAPGNKAKPYRANILPELHQLLLQENVPLDDLTTWWEVVDALFERGHVHEAIQAQRYAVPVLADIATQIALNQGILYGYDKDIREAARTALVDASDAYVVLKEPTHFDLGDAQIVSLDLDEVATRGGEIQDRQSAIMYMLARHVLGSRFFLMPADVELMPKAYQAYHAERIEAIREDPKRLCYEEDYRRKISSVLI